MAQSLMRRSFETVLGMNKITPTPIHSPLHHQKLKNFQKISKKLSFFVMIF